jgi:hypothetical protein
VQKDDKSSTGRAASNSELVDMIGFVQITIAEEGGGTMHDLKLQEEEVDEVIRLNLQDFRDRMQQSPDEFTPDSIHAMDL